MSAYFSAILSTADSCLMACSGNVVADLMGRKDERPSTLRLAQVMTAILGAVSLLLAARMTSVLDLMLLSYAFMVSGLFVPVLAILLPVPRNALAATASILVGGSVTAGLVVSKATLPGGLDANVFGLSSSALTYLLVVLVKGGTRVDPPQDAAPDPAG
jgi:SSS family solute:Na+ symporter